MHIHMDLSAEDKEKIKRVIAAGSVLAGAYIFDQLTADEYFEKDKDGNFVLKRKTTLDEIFE